MIDKTKLILENVDLFPNKELGYHTYGNRRRNKDVNSYRRFISLSDEKNAYELEIHLNHNIRFDKKQLVVDGNLRKWYFGKDSRQDFTKKKFLQCINLLSNKIGIDDASLYNAKVTKLETGVILRLKQKERAIINSIFGYKGFDKNTYDKYGVEFKSSNYDVIFYDHLRRVYNQKGKRQSNFGKITNKNFLFRYEIQSHKMSGTPMFKEKLNTLLKVRNNWDYIGQNLIKTLGDVEFVKVISPETYVSIKNGGKKEMTKYLTFKGMEAIGIENFRVLLEQMTNKHKSEFKKDFVTLYNSFLEAEKMDYKKFLIRKLKKRVKALA
ncbi:MAG: hypothetical protein ABGW76_07070 [Mesonia sp.]|uniref:hypothetical protein n=1 Tax=Mesonia sp. TaxID=1960830 RepID=UPI0032420E2A